MLEEVLEKKSWLEEVGESDLPVAVYGMGNGASLSGGRAFGATPCCAISRPQISMAG